MKNTIMLSMALGFVLGAVALEKCDAISGLIKKGQCVVKSKFNQVKDELSQGNDMQTNMD